MPLTVETKIDLRLRALNSLAVKSLLSMFSERSQLFCHRLVRTENGLEQDGLSPRYTLMTLMGLHRGENFGMRNPFNSEAILGGVLASRVCVENLGDLGLLLWACALIAPERYEQVYREFNVATSLATYSDARQGCTMHLSWLLAGLAHGALAGFKTLPGLPNLARTAFKLIRKNQGRNGVFGHLGGGGLSITRALRARLGSFADQVYPVYAFAKFASAFDDTDAVELAQNCADTLCAVQGPLGQWWWHYDSRQGRVVGRYPVYSVHQDGMAPLALFALGEVSGRDYKPWIFKGLPWIYGENELQANMYDESADIIWRSIYLSKPETYFREAASLLGFEEQQGIPKGLRVRRECRPYHLGWELYAFAEYGFEAATEPCAARAASLSGIGAQN